MNPKERMRAALKAAQEVNAKAVAGNRTLTQDEVDAIAAHLKTFEAAKAEHEAGIGAGFKGTTLEQVQALMGGATGFAAAYGRSTPAKSWGEKLRQRFEREVGAGGSKAFPGTISVPSVIREDPVLIDGEPTRILDLIPRRPSAASSVFGSGVGNEFEWLRQTVRSLNAGGVPDNAQKPKSNIELTPQQDHFRVYATITDPFPKRYLDDYGQLIEILRIQLGEGLMEALEDDVVNGTGTVTAEVVNDSGVVTTQGNDPVKGVLNTSGVQIQAYATSVLNTLSAGRYKLTDSQETPNAWLMNSADVRALEMLTETGGAFLFGSGRSQLRQVIGDYPIITSSIVPAGTAVLGDFTKTELVIREDDHIDMDASGALFDRNQVKFRSEGRYGFAVLKPHAFIKVALA